MPAKKRTAANSSDRNAEAGNSPPESSEQPAKPRAPRRKPKHGKGELQTGNPGNKGGGRPPNLFRELCAELATGDKTVDNLRKILHKTRNPEKRFSQFIPALKFVAQHGGLTPAEKHEHTGANGGPVEVKTTQVWKFGDKEIQF